MLQLQISGGAGDLLGTGMYHTAALVLALASLNRSPNAAATAAMKNARSIMRQSIIEGINYDTHSG
jgi:hypothetical protein